MIEHKVESGRDVIFDGVVYRPDHDKIVRLPREFDNGDCRPGPAAVAEEKPEAQAEKKQRGKYYPAESEIADG